MRLADKIRTSSAVRDHWSDTLDEVENGVTVTVTRRDHEPVTLVDRQHYISLLQRAEELEELGELVELLADREVREGVAEAEAQIERGDGLSFEEAFGERL